MAGPVESLRQLAELVQPNTFKRLREAGALDARTPVAAARALPWLVGRGQSLGLVSQMNADAIGDKVAIHDRNGSLTWRELDRRVNRATHALSQCGLRGGDRITMLLRNGREIVEVALAAQKLGIVACPVNTWAKPKELKSILGQADPALLVYDTAHSEQLGRAEPGDLPLWFVGDATKALPESVFYEAVVADQPDSPPPPFTRDRGKAKVVIHTSGTTGTPKGAQRDASASGLGALANLLTVVPYRRDDIILCPAPMFHSFGLATFVFATALGATLVLPERFDPEESLALIEKHQATAASFVPVMIKRIVSLDDEVRSRYDLSSLRIVLASGSAMSPELRRAAMEVFGQVLYDLYGSTEIGWAAIATPRDMRERPKSVGRPVPGIDIAVFSQDGRRLGPDETGELFVRSDLLFDGYTSGESRDQREGYTSIGDVGHLDEDGYLYIEGRADDMVVVGGENIYPIEIEEVIEAIDGVQEAAVLGVEDEEYGQVLAAFVVGSASEGQIAKVCRAELASYKVPRRIQKLDELPRTSTGKVLKRELIAGLEGADPLERV